MLSGPQHLSKILFLCVFLAFTGFAAAQHVDDSAKIMQLKNDLEKEPANPKILFQLGWYMQKMSYNSAAKEYYLRCLKTDPAYYPAIVNLGNLSKISGNQKEAENYYQKAIRADSAKSDGWYNLGALYLLQEKRKDAMECFEKTLKADPAHKEALLNISTLKMKEYSETKDIRYLNDAKIKLKKALQNDAQYAHAYYNLGMIHELLNKPDVALSYYKEAQRFYPKTSKFYRRSVLKIAKMKKTAK